MSSLGFDLTTPDGTTVGSASSIEAAASLASGIYSRTGASIGIKDTDLDQEVGWVGTRLPPAVVTPPLSLRSTSDTHDPQLTHFTLSNARGDTEVDFGDGESTLVVFGTPDFDHSFANAGTFHVVATCGTDRAEVYVTAGEVVASPLRLLSLEPDTAEIGSADITLHARGNGFQVGATIVFNGGDEATVFVTSEDLTTIVKPSVAGVAGSYPVRVRNADGGLTAELDFSFTEPVELPE